MKHINTEEVNDLSRAEIHFSVAANAEGLVEDGRGQDIPGHASRMGKKYIGVCLRGRNIR